MMDMFGGLWCQPAESMEAFMESYYNESFTTEREKEKLNFFFYSYYDAFGPRDDQNINEAHMIEEGKRLWWQRHKDMDARDAATELNEDAGFYDEDEDE